MINYQYDEQRQSSAKPTLAEWRVGADKGLHSPEIDQLRRDADREFNRLRGVPPARLMWMTVVGAALVVQPGNHASLVAAAAQDIERKIRSRARRRLSGLRIRGVHEIEYLTISPHMGAHKIALLKALGVDVLTQRNVSDQQEGNEICHTSPRILLPHLHCVIDLQTYSRAEVAEHFRSEFPGVWRTLGKSLYSHRTNEDNLTSLASYSTKFKVAYSDSYGDRATKFGHLYENVWQETMIATLRSIGVESMIYMYGGS